MVPTTELLAGRYRLGPLLGQGAMSDVYRGVDDASGDQVAVKLVRSGDADLARRLSQEVKVHERMVHPGLVRLRDTGVADGQAYLVMELVEGSTLAGALRHQRLGPRLTARLGATVGSALSYMHNAGIVHRDVKPSNILLAQDGRAILGDFGIARLLDASSFTMDGTTVGTVAYMAPEQLEDHQVGPAADIWSLGLVLLESLTGRRIYEGTSSEIIARRLAGPVPLPPELPVPWKLLLSGMLDHRPDQRLSGEEVAGLLAVPSFSAPWAPSAGSHWEREVPTAALDLTSLTPATARPSPVTAVTSPSGGTAVMPDPTKVAPVPAAPRIPQGKRRTRLTFVVFGVVALALLIAGVAYALSSGPTPPTPPTHGHGTTTSTRVQTTTTIPPTTTTTTAAPTAPQVLGTLVSDVATGIDNGTIDQADGQNLTRQAQQAVSDEASGNPQQAANDLQQAAEVIAQGEQSGSISGAEGSLLQNDLSSLAQTLGLGAAAAPETTTTSPGPASGPGHGHGNGND